jgi:hypothetical protein
MASQINAAANNFLAVVQHGVVGYVEGHILYTAGSIF